MAIAYVLPSHLPAETEKRVMHTHVRRLCGQERTSLLYLTFNIKRNTNDHRIKCDNAWTYCNMPGCRRSDQLKCCRPNTTWLAFTCIWSDSLWKRDCCWIPSGLDWISQTFKKTELGQWNRYILVIFNASPIARDIVGVCYPDDSHPSWWVWGVKVTYVHVPWSLDIH